MRETKVGTRYALSLLDLALEQNALEQVQKDMNVVNSTIESNKDFVAFLTSPIIKADKKAEVLKSIFSGKISDLSLSFLVLLAKKRRETNLPEIMKEFHNLYNKHKGIQRAIVTTSIGLDEELRKKVLKLVKDQTNSEIELIEKVDKDLIGGFTLQLGDKWLDSSIVRSLKSLRRDLNKNPYKSDL